MALTCTPAALQDAAGRLEQSLTHKGLLAALVYVLCEANNMDCTPASLAAASECFRCNMTEKGLLAAAVYILCNGGSGGGGVSCGNGAPTGVPASGCGLYIQLDSTPIPREIWSYANGAWE